MTLVAMSSEEVSSKFVYCNCICHVFIHFMSFIICYLREKMIESNKLECNDLADIMFAMEQEFNELKTEALHDFQSQKDEIKNKVIYKASLPP